MLYIPTLEVAMFKSCEKYTQVWRDTNKTIDDTERTSAVFLIEEKVRLSRELQRGISWEETSYGARWMKMKPVRGTFHAEPRSERASESARELQEVRDITVMATLCESNVVITARGLVARKHLDEDWYNRPFVFIRLLEQKRTRTSSFPTASSNRFRWRTILLRTKKNLDERNRAHSREPRKYKKVY